MSLTIDILEERVTEMEKRLNDTITRIFKLESLLPIISLQVKDTDDSYNFSDSDDVPPLPPPVVPPVIPPPAPVVPTPPTAGQYYMAAAPMYLHQTGQPPYFQHTSPLTQLSYQNTIAHHLMLHLPCQVQYHLLHLVLCLSVYLYRGKGRKMVLQFFPVLSLIKKTFLLVTSY